MATCIVLGAGSGVSNSVAREFAQRGYHIALCSRSPDRLEKLAQGLGSNASCWNLDVSDLDEVKSVIEKIAQTHPNVEVLVFNAYSAEPGKSTVVDPRKFDHALSVNITSALAATQAVIPFMRKLGKGTVLITGGGFALQPFSDLSALSVGKAGLRALAQCLYDELKDEGIHASTVTICGTVQPGTNFAPDLIAKAFMQLHDEPNGSFSAEIMFTGDR